MSFIRIRTRKNRRYIYRETRWREGRRMRSRSEYIGPLDGSPGPSRQFDEAQDRAMVVAEREAARVDAYQRAAFGETALEKSHREQSEHLDQLYTDYGLKLGPSNPMPPDPLQGVPVTGPERDEAAVEAMSVAEAQEGDLHGSDESGL